MKRLALLIALCVGCKAGASNSASTAVQEPSVPPPTAAGATAVGGAGTGSGAPAAGNGTAGLASAAGAGAGAKPAVAGSGGSAGSSAGAGGSAGANAGSEAGASAGTAAAGSSGAAGAAGSGGAGAPAAMAGQGGGDATGTRMPQFKKTACIDPSKVKPGTEINFPCQGVDIWVTMPSSCQNAPCGLIFNIHGGGMSDHATMDQATNLIKLGNAAGYIVVHPHKGTWNVSGDRSAVFGFMQQVIEAFDVDKKRVHSTGYSQGGQLSWALACEHADVVASIAPSEEINRVTDCWKPSKLPSREIPVLFAYGKKDSIGGGYAAAQKLAADFASASQMMGPETIAGAENSNYWRQRWTSKTGNVLEFISQNYTSTGVGGILAGHCLPMMGGDTFVSCSAPVDYDWGKEVLAFFQAHPMP